MTTTLPALFALAFAALLVWQLSRTHRKLQSLRGRRSPWTHVGPSAPRYGGHVLDRADR